MTKPKTTILDIETATITAHVWGLWDQTVGLNQIAEDWRILSFASKTLNEKPITYVDARTREAERALLQELWGILDESDIVVAHNGKKFDIKKINARLIQERFPPYSPVKVVDTLLIAKQVAAFTSNKLEYLTDKLCTTKKLKHGKFPGFELWKECFAGNPAAWAEMKKYNIRDITSLEELYVFLRPWMTGHPNIGSYVDPAHSDDVVCPRCGSQQVQKRGTTYTQVGQYQRYHCNSCGGWSRGRQLLKKAAERKHIITG